MDISLVLLGYAAVAALVTSYNFYHVVVLRPRPPVFTITDDVLMALAVIAVGAVWPIFMPALLVAAGRGLARLVSQRPAGWSIVRTGELRVR